MHITGYSNSDKIPIMFDNYSLLFQNNLDAKSIQHYGCSALFADNKISERDIEICKFIYMNINCSIEQIYRYLKLGKFFNNPCDDIEIFYGKKEEEEEEKETNKIKYSNDNESLDNLTLESLRFRIDKLVQYRLINRFQLAVGDKNRPPHYSDGYNVFCLDWGGKYLLSSLQNIDTTNWHSGINNCNATKVYQRLILTEIFLKVFESSSGNVVSFSKERTLKCYGEKGDEIGFLSQLQFAIERNGVVKSYIVEDVSNANLIFFDQRISNLKEIIQKNYKQLIYESDSPPTVLLFAKNITQANKMLVRSIFQSGYSNIRATFNDRLFEKDINVAFLKYNIEKEELVPIKIQAFS